ncbi:hypothetical protein SELMODRAFT_430771 [Selaginella moellendorffii]|uniref:Uncharacterized protein n=1 Tax=Selaginella moellendorffii TaxID=88036 RepID=D8TAG7_SELML|nr:hypothetical protein SELMODRAFT_430771 [Selaginella moellendorffii]
MTNKSNKNYLWSSTYAFTSVGIPSLAPSNAVNQILQEENISLLDIRQQQCNEEVVVHAGRVNAKDEKLKEIKDVPELPPFVPMSSSDRLLMIFDSEYNRMKEDLSHQVPICDGSDMQPPTCLIDLLEVGDVPKFECMQDS